jgi:recombinational DNA repair protein RecR
MKIGLSKNTWEGLKSLKKAGAEVVFVAKKEFEHRISMCEGCEKFTHTRQCSICKCFMDVKARLRTDPVESVKQLKRVESKCPILKW